MSLDPFVNRLVKEAEKNANDPRNVPLNPPFPYKVTPFDPAEFRLNVPPTLDTPTATK